MIWTGDGWEIRQGRWQDSAPDSVDHVIADPPYDAATHRGGMRGVGSNPDGGSKEICMSAPKSFDPIEPADVGPPLLALSKRWVVLFCAVEQLGDYRRASPKEYCRGAIWVRGNPPPQFSGDRPGQWGDGIAVLHPRGRKRWNLGGTSGIWRSLSARFDGSGQRVHETQKPVGLMMQLIVAFTDPDDLVWDPYCGSGTTGVACLRLGRRFLGHEMQPHYAEIAARRLAAEDRGLTLAEADRGQQSIFDTLEKT